MERFIRGRHAFPFPQGRLCFAKQIAPGPTVTTSGCGHTLQALTKPRAVDFLGDGYPPEGHISTGRLTNARTSLGMESIDGYPYDQSVMGRSRTRTIVG